MDRECFNEIVDLLVPYLDTPDTRKAYIQSAWYGSALTKTIDWTGSAQIFTTLVVAKALDFGEIEPGIPAIQALLKVIGDQSGDKTKKKIELLTKYCLASELGTGLGTVARLPRPNNQSTKKHVFISYSRRDRAIVVEQIVEDLTNTSWKIWIDNLDVQNRGIISGKAWRQEIANAINQSSIFLFIMSPDSLQSEWCIEELKLAGWLSIPIVPILIRSLDAQTEKALHAITIGEINLGDLQICDFVKVGYKLGVEMLKADINKHLSDNSTSD